MSKGGGTPLAWVLSDGGGFWLTFGGCGGECRVRGQRKGVNSRISNREMSNVEGMRKKAMRVVWKQDPKAGISGNHIKRS